MSNNSELNMELYADYVAMRADRDSLREALIDLVKVNEEHNQSMMEIIGRPTSWNDSYLDKARKAIAAPAEDVRAVGEEPNPFGYWRVPKGAPLQGAFLLWESDGPYGNSDSHIASAIDAGFSVKKLYSHPQRPVVFPERMVVPATRSFQGPLHIAYDVAAGYNACIDEFERLNKC